MSSGQNYSDEERMAAVRSRVSWGLADNSGRLYVWFTDLPLTTVLCPAGIRPGDDPIHDGSAGDGC